MGDVPPQGTLELPATSIGRLLLCGVLALTGCGSAAPDTIQPKPRALLQEARSLGQQGRSEEAIAKLQSYLRENPRTLGVNFTLGTLLLAAADNRAAVDCFRSELELKPNHAASYAQLGSAYERLGDFEQVVQCFETQATLSQADWKPSYRAGLILRKYLQRLDAAETHLFEARRRHPKGAELRIELGRVFLDQGRDEEALELFREVLVDHPEHPEVHLHLGQLLVRRGSAQEGAALLARFKQLAAERDRLGQLEVAGTAGTQCLAGVEFLRQEKWRKALGAFKMAIELDANDPCGYIGIARVHTSQGKFREALSRLAQASKLDPKSFELHFRSALALAGGKRKKEAFGALQAARGVRALTPPERAEIGAVFRAAGIDPEATVEPSR